MTDSSTEAGESELGVDAPTGSDRLVGSGKGRSWRFRFGWLGLLQLATTLIALGALYYSARQVSEHAAPHLDAYAFFLRTPVPDVIALSLRSMPPDTLEKYEDIIESIGALGRPLQESSGVWHITVQNNGDGVATNVRIEVPGALASRGHLSAAGETRQSGSGLIVDRLSPGGRISAFIWVRSPYYLDEVCVPNRSEPGCFTTSDLSVFADDAGAHIYVEPFTQPETADHRVRWWENRLIWLATLVALVLIGGFFGPRREREGS